MVRIANNKMIEAITTLPIAPTANPTIGRMVIPFVMNVLGKRMHYTEVLALNVNGEKFKNKDVEDSVSGYVESSNALGIFPDFVWRDDQRENNYWYGKFFGQLLDRGHITKEKSEIMRCSCCAVESLANAENISQSNKLYYSREDGEYCKLCGSVVSNMQEYVYLFRFPDIQDSIRVKQTFYEKELKQLANRFLDRKFLISKSRKTAFNLENGGENAHIDVNYLWYMYLPILRRYGYSPSVVVGDSKNLMASCFIIAMLKLIDDSTTTLVTPPYYLAPERKQLSGDSYLLNGLLERYSPEDVRILLSTAINWSKKESVLDFSLIDLISKMSYRLKPLEEDDDQIEALTNFNGTKVKESLARARKTQRLFFSKDFLGIIPDKPITTLVR